MRGLSLIRVSGVVLSAVGRGLLTVLASPVSEHRLSAHGLQRLQLMGSGVVALGLSLPMACGIFPDQGSDTCPLHWQVDHYSLHHQGNPQLLKINKSASFTER